MGVGRNVVETIVGGLVLVVAALFVFYAFGKSDRAGPDGYEVIARFGRIDGLKRGSDVTLSGVKVGTVTSFDLDGAPTAGERLAAMRALRGVDAQDLAKLRYEELSYGQARRVLFARALSRDPDILLLDEPYTGLDAPVRKQLIGLVETLASKELTVVIATHHRDEWPQRTTHELELVSGAVLYCGPARP